MLLGGWLPGWNPYPGLRRPASLNLGIWGFLLTQPSFFGVKGGDLSFANAWDRINFILKLPTDVRELGYRCRFAIWVLFGYSVSQTGEFSVAVETWPRELRPISPTCPGSQGVGRFSPPRSVSCVDSAWFRGLSLSQRRNFGCSSGVPASLRRISRQFRVARAGASHPEPPEFSAKFGCASGSNLFRGRLEVFAFVGGGF